MYQTNGDVSSLDAEEEIEDRDRDAEGQQVDRPVGVDLERDVSENGRSGGTEKCVKPSSSDVQEPCRPTSRAK